MNKAARNRVTIVIGYVHFLARLGGGYDPLTCPAVIRLQGQGLSR